MIFDISFHVTYIWLIFQAFQKWIDKAIPYVTPDEIEIMKKSVKDLQIGADAEVVEAILPGIEVPNSKNLAKPEIGSLFSDKIADWISKNYVIPTVLVNVNILFNAF